MQFVLLFTAVGVEGSDLQSQQPWVSGPCSPTGDVPCVLEYSLCSVPGAEWDGKVKRETIDVDNLIIVHGSLLVYSSNTFVQAE